MENKSAVKAHVTLKKAEQLQEEDEMLDTEYGHFEM
jgi:hypothetical protein